MIGIFDSGLGAIQTAVYIHECLPYEDVYILADSRYAPYGKRDHTWIRDRTFTCLHRLFDQGCSLVILACNTASTVAIVEWQEKYPEKKVLSVTIPGVEKIIEGGYSCVGVLATQVSIDTDLYPHMFAKHYADHDLVIEQVVGTGLVTAIESDNTSVVDNLCSNIVSGFSDNIQALVLGCTHYPLVESAIRKKLPDNLPIINPGAEAGKKLILYKQTHLDLFRSGRGGSGNLILYTTQDHPYIHDISSLLLGDKVMIDEVEIE